MRRSSRRAILWNSLIMGFALLVIATTSSCFASKAAEPAKRVDRFPVYQAPLLFAYVDKTGKTQIKPQYFIANQFESGYATVAMALNKWGVINSKGQWVLKPTYNSMGTYSEGLIPAMPDTGEGAYDWGYINLAGKWVIKPQFRGAYEFRNGYAEAMVKDRWGVIDKTGKAVIPFEYRNITAYQDGLIGVLKDYGEAWQFIDIKGKVILDDNYRWTRGFSEGLAAIRNDKELWGFIDTTGKLIIPYQYQDVNSFSEGLAAVQNDKGLYGAINPQGDWIIEPQFMSGFRFINGHAYVEHPFHQELIDKTGRIVWHNKPKK